ncbi:MAG TPA: glycosyltransferase, partial [Pseudoxanthomonas sp.]|nr:glycosyltransferase [Pseudoxanthomonas sp.]
MASLRTRGFQESWRRLKLFLIPAPTRPSGRMNLYFPDDLPFVPFAVPHSGQPRASIVIPVYNQFAHTLACLRALAEHPPQAAIEIIVVDDGSSDETGECLPLVDGLRYHRRARNGGFIAACNDGASMSGGEYLVMLNNDTVPQPGWLDAMLQTFASHPQAGLVGAQLLYPDGLLQEAGGVVFADGSAWNYGRFDNPDHPRYSYLRDADYCSGAAIAIPRALFESLGGFDTRYSPAYYEDTDLAFAVRDAGLRVLYQPLACVVHKEGTTSGTDLGSGAKAYQIVNGEKFAHKWEQALPAQSAPGQAPSPATLHAGKRQVLIIDALTPQPDRDSGSLRLFNLIRLLQEEGAHVCFVADNPAHAGAYTEALQQLGVETWYAPYVGNFTAFLQQQGNRFDTVMLCRHYVATAFLPLLARHAPQARVVFDTVDLHYLRERRGAEMNGDDAMLRASEVTRTSELAVMARADVTLVVSQVEQEWLAHEAPGRVVEVLSNLHRVAGPGEPYCQRRDLVFVGGFRHPPNVDAAVWFAQVAMPLVRERLPDVVFHCIG